MKRIYVQAQLCEGGAVALEEAAFHYLFRVLRCRDGEQIIAFNGDGNDYRGTLQQQNKKTATLSVASCTKNNRESPLYTTLLQAVSKGDRMDFAIQKAVELGVNEIYPVHTEFSAVKLNTERQHKKHQHWQSIIRSACEQSQRAVMPTLHPVLPFASAIESCHADKKIVLHPYNVSSATPTLFEQQMSNKAPQHVALLIGAEGGLSKSEVSEALNSGFTRLQLGNRILRTETAAISALSIVQYLWGDYVQEA